MKEYGMFWKNYVNFTGKSTRKEFWIPMLFNIVVIFMLVVSLRLSESSIDSTELIGTMALIYGVFLIALFIPSLAVTVRRFRDAGFGWYWVIIFIVINRFTEVFAEYTIFTVIGLACWIIEIIMLCQPSKTVVSEAGDNEEKG
ncbi:DUF805 domain-containing protein [Lactobacillus sp. YT155]|uniref:DUF805 domain-containing protein n=1 Tax=Lactobacillus sp. YT155 TaxID=3060955 RepID=UPI00265EAD78|nr:DUF805 domain-containing protein [Lactobacillus sp. YT155]MDO1604748.1 DUF805 domain-containing protein [Lactobacillus sp. YT155]